MKIKQPLWIRKEQKLEAKNKMKVWITTANFNKPELTITELKAYYKKHYNFEFFPVKDSDVFSQVVKEHLNKVVKFKRVYYIIPLNQLSQHPIKVDYLNDRFKVELFVMSKLIKQSFDSRLKVWNLFNIEHGKVWRNKITKGNFYKLSSTLCNVKRVGNNYKLVIPEEFNISKFVKELVERFQIFQIERTGVLSLYKFFNPKTSITKKELYDKLQVEPNVKLSRTNKQYYFNFNITV